MWGWPAKWSNTDTGKKNSQAVGRWAFGSKLVVLKMACSQSGCKISSHPLVSPYEQFEDTMRVILF
jgi:hypothetical protein